MLQKHRLPNLSGSSTGQQEALLIAFTEAPRLAEALPLEQLGSSKGGGEEPTPALKRFLPKAKDFALATFH